MITILYLIVQHAILYTIVAANYELFLTELDGSSGSNTNWINTATNLPLTQLVCNTGLAQYIAKGESNVKRVITMPTQRLYTKVKINLELFFIGTWDNKQYDLTIYINSITYYDKSPSQKVDADSKYFCQSIAGLGADTFQRVEMIAITQDPTLTIEIEAYPPPTSQYGISNVLIFINYGEIEGCIEYSSQSEQCLQCEQNYTLKNNQCECNYNIHYNPQKICIVTCPTGYLQNTDNVCQLGTSNIIYSDLASVPLTNYKFKYYPDTLHQYSNDIKLIDVNGQTLAGPFRNNDKIEFENINIIAPITLKLSFKIYLVGLAQQNNDIKYSLNYINSRIELLLNDYWYGNIIFFDKNSIMAVGVSKISQTSCSNTVYSLCEILELSIIQKFTDSIDKISFNGFFNVHDYNCFWAIKDLIIDQYTFSPLVIPCDTQCVTCKTDNLKYCLTCPTSKLQYYGKCIDKCPYFAPNDGSGNCIDSDMTPNLSYLVNHYNTNYYHSQNDFIENPSLNIIKDEERFSYNQYYQKLMIGGYDIWQKSQLIFNKKVTPFYKIKIQFFLLFIDFHDPAQKFRLSIGLTNYDITDIGMTSFGNQIGQLQHEKGGYYTYTQSYSVSQDQTQIVFTCFSGNVKPLLSCAIEDLVIKVLTCPQYCTSCDGSGVCTTYIDTISTGSTGCKSGYFLDSTNTCSQCQNECLTCNSYSSCSSCSSDKELYNQKCYCKGSKLLAIQCDSSKCNVGCTLCRAHSMCIQCDSSLHRWLNIDKCECIDGYYEDSDKSCQKCYPTCVTCISNPRKCLTCHSTQFRHFHSQNCVCDDGYFEDDSTIICQKCEQKCKSCSQLRTKCTDCYQSQYRTLIGNECSCQDGYYENNDIVCAKCHDLCATCSNATECKTCKSSQNRQMSKISDKCICMSGFYEITNQLDCVACHYQCQECTSFASNKCTRCPSTREFQVIDGGFECKCKKGYYDDGFSQDCIDCATVINPSPSHFCYSNCGDGIVQWNEQCDDGNTIPRDGCNNCLLPTSHCLDSSCTKCHAGICTACIDGYYLGLDSICHICNSICLKCITRPDNCTSCTIPDLNGTGCVNCRSELGFQIVDNKCLNICGDGIKVEGEECDDGNTTNGDGCNSSCQIEEGSNCSTSCQKIEYVKINLEEKKTDQLYKNDRNLLLTLNQEVQITGQLTTNLIVEIQNFTNFTYSIHDSTTYTTQYYEVQVNINIQLNEGIQQPLAIVRFQLPENINSKQGYSFENNYDSMANITLLDYELPDNGVQSATNGLMALNLYIMYVMLGLAITAFLFGGLNIFWNLLDLLQLLAYIKYFNVQYPFNVQSFFTLFGFAEFDFLKENLDLQNYVTLNTPEAAPKFRDEGYTSLFYVNIIGVIIVFLTTFGTYLMCLLLQYIFKRIATYILRQRIDDEEEANVNFYFLMKVTKNFENYLFKMSSQFKSGILRTFMAVAFDLNLAIFLQLKDVVYNDFFLFSSAFIAFVVLLLEIFFIYKAFVFMSKPQYHFKLQETENMYGSLYEGVILGKRTFSSGFNIITLVKKMLFMFFLVFLYDVPTYQIGMVSILNVGFAAYVIYMKPLEDIFEFHKTYICELIIWIIELLAILFVFNNQTNYLDSSFSLMNGWIIIILCCILILLQLVIDIIQHGTFLINKYKILQQLLFKVRGYFYQRILTEDEDNIFIRSYVPSGKSKSQHKIRKVVTFSVSNSSSDS